MVQRGSVSVCACATPLLVSVLVEGKGAVHPSEAGSIIDDDLAVAKTPARSALPQGDRVCELGFQGERN